MQLPEKINDWKSEQLDITISYDRVLQLESLLTRNSCEQLKKDNVLHKFQTGMLQSRP